MSNNKVYGFTLIELLAVIVILAIIALIATPIVLDIIDDTKKSSVLRSADFYLDGVEFSIANAVLDNGVIKDGVYYVIGEGNICLEEYDTSTKTCNDSNSDNKIEILEVEVNGEVPEVGSTVEIKAGNIGKINLNYNGQKISKKVDGSLALNMVCTVLTGDGTKVGDEIECAGEHFYVISNDGSKINMLAKYNLDVGNIKEANIVSPSSVKVESISNPSGIQSEKARGALLENNGNVYSYGCVDFSTSYYWQSSSNSIPKESYGTSYPVWVYTDKEGNVDETNLIYTYVENYEKYLKENGVNVLKATLISYEQLISLGCDAETNSCASEVNFPNYANTKGNAPEWVYSTTYFSGSAYDGDDIWNVFSIGAFVNYVYTRADIMGVRPVIIIGTSEI